MYTHTHTTHICVCVCTYTCIYTYIKRERLQYPPWGSELVDGVSETRRTDTVEFSARAGTAKSEVSCWKRLIVPDASSSCRHSQGESHGNIKHKPAGDTCRRICWCWYVQMNEYMYSLCKSKCTCTYGCMHIRMHYKCVRISIVYFLLSTHTVWSELHFPFDANFSPLQEDPAHGAGTSLFCGQRWDQREYQSCRNIKQSFKKGNM